MGRLQLSETALSQWCQKNIPNFTLAEFAQQNITTVTTAFKSLTDIINQGEHKSLLWATFTSSGVDILKICQQLRKPLVPNDKLTHNGLVLNLWSYICFLNVLVIDGAGANSIFDVGTFQYAIEQPVSVCKFLTRETQSKKKPIKSGRGKSSPDNGDSEDEEEDSENENESNSALSTCGFKASQVDAIMQLVNRLLSALNVVMERVSIAQSEISQHVLVNRITTTLHYCTLSKPKEISKLLSSNLCFKVLFTYLTNPIHQAALKEDSGLMKHLLPLILMKSPNSIESASVPSGSSGQGLTQPVARVAESCVKFVQELLREKPDACQSAFILTQHMTVDVVDKMDYRSKTAEHLVAIMSLFPENVYQVMSQWLFSKLHCQKQNERVFVLDVLENLLNFSSTPGNENKLDLDKDKLVSSILERCNDKVPGIRAKALSCVSTLCKLQSSEIQDILKLKIKQENQIHHPADENIPDESHAITNGNISTRNYGQFEQLCALRCRDEKFNVKKSALQAFVDVAVYLISTDPLNQDLLTTALNEASSDSSLMIRKLCIDCSTQLLLASPLNHKFRQTWLLNVMPLFADGEKAVVEKAISTFEQIILDPLTQIESSDETEASFKVTLAWNLLDILTVSDTYMYYYRLGAADLSGRVLARNVNKLVECLKSRKHEVACWMLLSQVMKEKENKAIANEAKNELNDNLTMDNSSNEQKDRFKLAFILDIFCYASTKTISQPEMNQIVNSLLACASKFTLPLHSTTDILSALVLICEKYNLKQLLHNFAKITAEATKSEMNNFDPSIIYLMEDTDVYKANLIRKLFLVGQLTFCNLHDSTNTMAALKACFEPLIKMMRSVVSVRKRNVEELMVMEDDSLSSLQAVAVITLGNMCLIFEKFNRQGTEILGEILNPLKKAEGDDDFQTTSFCSLKVANNVILILCDLCKRYTHTVERFLPRIYRYLACPDAFLRYQTLACVFELLKHDYIKIRDSLFFRMTTLYVDECEKVSQLAEYCLERIANRHKNVFFSHFVESVFFLNEYHKHHKYNQFPKEGRVPSGISDRVLSHANQSSQPDGTMSPQEKRLVVYQFLAVHLSESQRFQLKVKLMTEVFGVYVQSEEPVDAEFDFIMSDVLKLITLKAMKTAIASRDNNPGDTTLDPRAAPNLAGTSEETSSSVSNASKLAEMVRETTLEVFFPLMLNLREKLKKEKKEALVGDLLGFFGDLIKQNKNEISRRFHSQEAKSVESEVKRSQCVPIRQYYKRQNLTSTLDYSIGLNVTGMGARLTPTSSFSFGGHSSVAGGIPNGQNRTSSVYSRGSSGDFSSALLLHPLSMPSSPPPQQPPPTIPGVASTDKEGVSTNDPTRVSKALLTPIQEVSQESTNGQFSTGGLSKSINNENLITSTPFG